MDTHTPHYRAFCLRYEASGGGTEEVLVGTSRSRRSAEPSLVVRPSTPLAGLLSGVGKLLRGAALGLYVSPLLILAKIVLGLVSVRASDQVIPIFVVLVVMFFGLLDLYIFVFALHWLMRRRQAPPAFAPAQIDSNVVATALGASSGEKVCVRGRIRRLDGLGGTPESDGRPVVLRAFEATNGAHELVRLCEMECFAVEASDGTLVVIQGDRVPLLASPPARHAISPGEFGLRHAADALATELREVVGSGWELRTGDLVDVSGPAESIAPSSAHFQIAGADASLAGGPGEDPYRAGGGGRPVVLLAGEADRRVVVGLV